MGGWSAPSRPSVGVKPVVGGGEGGETVGVGAGVAGKVAEGEAGAPLVQAGEGVKGKGMVGGKGAFWMAVGVVVVGGVVWA